MRALLLAMISFVCLLLLLLIESEAQLLAEPIVDTQYGQVLGNRKLYEGSIYDEYLGIPFAAPPVDSLRWQKPQPLEPWDGLWNATQYSIHCTQLIAPIYRFLGMGGISGEDCLYLNVWVPGGIRANNSESLLPVMVYIYGGAFVVGTGEMYPGYALALHGQMIVVNFNYRVSSLGWLSSEDSSLPGNYGLWDTKAALEWVRDNIAAFNGDPAQVTLFGQSAGGMITSHAVVSAQTNSLFRNAIAISGSSTGPSGLTTQALRTTVLLADIFNCTYNTTQEIVDCLMEEDAHDLDFWGNVGMSMYYNQSSNLRPVIDGDFVLRRPRESFEMGEGSHINFVTGFCHDDSASFVIRNPVGSPFLYDKLNVAATNESMWEHMMRELGDTANPEELAASIYGVYPGLGSSDNFTRTLAATECFTEWSFGSGSNLEAGLHRNAAGTGKTFEYYFHYRQTFLVGYPEWINGTHMDDLYSVFGWPFMEPFRRLYLNEDFDEMDFDISERIMNYYSNFVRTGDPNIGPYEVVFPWNEFDPAKQNFLRQSPNFEEGNFYDEDNNMVDRFYYWNEVYPTLVRYPPDPEIPPTTTLIDTYEAPTATDIRLAVDSLKKTLEEMIPNEEIFAEIEETIDRFLEKKNFEL